MRWPACTLADARCLASTALCRTQAPGSVRMGPALPLVAPGADACLPRARSRRRAAAPPPCGHWPGLGCASRSPGRAPTARWTQQSGSPAGGRACTGLQTGAVGRGASGEVSGQQRARHGRRGLARTLLVDKQACRQQECCLPCRWLNSLHISTSHCHPAMPHTRTRTRLLPSHATHPPLASASWWNFLNLASTSAMSASRGFWLELSSTVTT